MARNRSAKQSDWLGFFNYYLDPEEKIAIRTLIDDKKRPSLESVIADLVNHGYKVSISANDEAGSFICAVTGKTSSANRGYTYAVTHIDLVTAIYATWFVISNVLEWDEWPVDESNVPNW